MKVELNDDAALLEYIRKLDTALGARERAQTEVCRAAELVTLCQQSLARYCERKDASLVAEVAFE